MSRSHKIWVDVTGGSGKPFGCGQDDIKMKVYVGLSSTNSKLITTIKLEQSEHNGVITYDVVIDGQKYRSEILNRKTGEFRGIRGRRISGSPKLQKKRATSELEAHMKSVGVVMAMGEIFSDGDQKASNDWKARMLKAGMQDKGLIMPDDWDTLSEDEKQKRLDGVIKVFTETDNAEGK